MELSSSKMTGASWFLTVIRTQGMRLMRPDREWRPIVTIDICDLHPHPHHEYGPGHDDEHEYDTRTDQPQVFETLMGVDGQNPNLKHGLYIPGPATLPPGTPSPSASSSTLTLNTTVSATTTTSTRPSPALNARLEIGVWYTPPAHGKKKVKSKKRVLVGSAQMSVGELLKMWEKERGRGRGALDLRLTCHSPTKGSISSRNGALLTVRLRAPPAPTLTPSPIPPTIPIPIPESGHTQARVIERIDEYSGTDTGGSGPVSPLDEEFLRLTLPVPTVTITPAMISPTLSPSPSSPIESSDPIPTPSPTLNSSTSPQSPLSSSPPPPTIVQPQLQLQSPPPEGLRHRKPKRKAKSKPKIEVKGYTIDSDPCPSPCSSSSSTGSSSSCEPYSEDEAEQEREREREREQEKARFLERWCHDTEDVSRGGGGCTCIAECFCVHFSDEGAGEDAGKVGEGGRGESISVGWVSASLLPQHTLRQGSSSGGGAGVLENEAAAAWRAQMRGLSVDEKAALPAYTERVQVEDPDALSLPERILATFTLYAALRAARVDSEFEAVFARLQMEWGYVGGLLVALAAVNTAVLSISSDALFTVHAYARGAVAASSVASGLGIACDAWFLLRYGWAEVGVVRTRALDVFNSYFFFALSARTPSLCMFTAALSLMAFLALVAFDAWPGGALVVCGLVGAVMGLQFLVWGAVWLGRGVRGGVRGVGRGVRGVVGAVGVGRGRLVGSARNGGGGVDGGEKAGR
ncbi:hypothetical protein BDZ94DRAFT_1299794 [Collybia nuda]|uniref:Uncharacterized protein n=1 Tax=Collybia nuda TaxID=64659 RepID=A0A9P5Y1H8_9AGAR|nr:hypothetical protein BDZ94DRAFT_1299794 [Collybia nuda]